MPVGGDEGGGVTLRPGIEANEFHLVPKAQIDRRRPKGTNRSRNVAGHRVVPSRRDVAEESLLIESVDVPGERFDSHDRHPSLGEDARHLCLDLRADGGFPLHEHGFGVDRTRHGSGGIVDTDERPV